jgi:hypothetical protein
MSAKSADKKCNELKINFGADAGRSWGNVLRAVGGIGFTGYMTYDKRYRQLNFASREGASIDHIQSSGYS